MAGPTCAGPPGVGRALRQGHSWSAKGEIDAIVSSHLSAMQTALSRDLEALTANREQRIQEILTKLQRGEAEEYRKADPSPNPTVQVQVPGQSTTCESIEKVRDPEEEVPEATPQPQNEEPRPRRQSLMSVVPAGLSGGGVGSTALSRMNRSSRNSRRQSDAVTSGGPRPSDAAVSVSGGGQRTSIPNSLSRQDNPMFDLWPAWKVENNTIADRLIPNRLQANKTTELQILEPPSLRLTNLLARFTGVINPSSPFSCFWNIMFMTVLCYELIVMPLRIFDLPKGGVLWVLGLSAVTFWSCDLVLSFNVGYYTKAGQLVLDRRRIIAKYAGAWMLPDMFIVCLDWVLLVSEQSDMGSFPSLLRIGKALRYVRVLRVLRLLRLRKLRETIHLLDEFVSSEYFSISKNVFLNMIGILVISHFLGCLWFLVGNISVHGYPSWVDHYQFHDKEWGYQYLTSLHWSLTQITPGSMEVLPQNIPERAFAVVVLILGIIVFSSIVSSITSAVNNLKSIGARYDKQRWMLRRFFREQCVSHELASRVTRYADNIIRPQQKRVGRNEVELLGLLPASLYMDVMLELFDKSIEVHPLFNSMHAQNKAVMQKICCALETTHLPKDDVLFIPGETAQAMYWVTQGEFSYMLREADANIVNVGDWFCEPVLWTPWVHQGSMESTTDSELVILDSRKFQDVTSHHRADMQMLKRYGKEFVNRMNELGATIGTASVSENSLWGDVALSDLLKIDIPLAMFEVEKRASTTRSPRTSQSK